MMSIIGVPRERLERIVEPSNSLRSGQIVQGKILKIYPNHRAELQIGSQKMVAQLEAPLAVGERYHFQVTNTEDVIELKVIGSTLRNNPTTMENISQLLNELNIQSSRPTLQFVQTLMNEKIPFTKQQLQQAIRILQQANGSTDAQRVLVEILGRNLPMTESVFNALLVKGMTNTSNEFSSLLNALQTNQMGNNVQNQLIEQLLQMLNSNNNSSNQLVHQLSSFVNPVNVDDIINQLIQNRQSIISNAQQLLNILPNDPSQFTQYNVEQAKRIINQMQVPNDVKQMLLTMLNNNRAELLNVVRSLANNTAFTDLQSFISNNSVQQQFLSHINQFTLLSGLTYENTVQHNVLNMSGQNIEQVLNQLLVQQTNIQQAASQLTNKWAPYFDNDANQQMNDTQLIAFKRDVEEQIVRLLPQNQRSAVLNLLQSNDSTERVWQFMQTLSRSDTFDQLNNLLLNAKDNNINLSTNMMNQMPEGRALLQSLLMSPELTVNHGANDQLQQTIKGLLLQLVQQNDSALGDRAQQTLHFINGLQLNSVNETSHFIQASIQVPGDQIGLNGDLYMDFESQKTEDGKIDSDYCRILFFLNLHGLDETVIDMNVQKRLVTITIYNENNQLNLLAKPLYEPLRAGLEKINYQLSTVRFKSLYEQTGQKESTQNNIYDDGIDNRKGVDFRV